ncbi:hypothetical protein A7981_06210 [Methylovorus sp. MM2]|uniref:hypothetical protein n=1 Tax=Methylovorus sp. MM2 TaxID=1848038 RepID=UPI0007E25147|nr:hypothetical protein [Methylovorus sp. MM2]OAM53019.1 hypothetical protein A7981_06210 [Methylovorus sp. MM2]
MPAQENGHAVRKLMKIPLSFTLEDSPPSNKFSYNEAETTRVLKDVKEAQAKLYSKNVAIEKQIVDLDVPQIYAASSLATKMGRNASKKKLESLRALSKQANDATNDYLNELILKSKSSSDISIEEKERFEAALKELSKPLFKLLFDSYVNQVNIINSSISLISFCEKNSSKMKVVDLELAILDEDVQEGFEEIFQQIVDLTDKQEELEKAITEFSTNFQNIGNAEFDTDSSPADLRQAWNEIKEMSKQADEQSKLINEASH